MLSQQRHSDGEKLVGAYAMELLASTLDVLVVQFRLARRRPSLNCPDQRPREGPPTPVGRDMRAPIIRL